MDAGQDVQLRRGSLCVLWLLLAACAILGPAVAPGEASAQSTRGDERAKAEAKRHYRQGAKAFRQGDYDRAIAEFRRAHRLSPDGMLLYNLSLAHARAGHLDEAIAYGERAEQSGGLTRRAQIRNGSRLAALRAARSARRVAGSIDRRMAENSRDDDAPDDPAGPPTIPETETDSAGHRLFAGPLFWTGVSLVGSGLASIGAAGLVDLSLSDDLDAYRAAARRGDTRRYRRLRGDIERRQTVGRVLFYGGVGAAAAGLALFGAHAVRNDAVQRRTLLAPRLGPDRIGVDLRLPFR